jgi:hypothetical protein
MANNIVFLVSLGLVAGVFSGFFGIGGGIILIPALLYFLGMSQHMAQGTTLALMVPPIGLLAAWKYYSAGHVDVKTAACICAGFFIGGLLGAQGAELIPDHILKKVFGAFMLVISLKMIFWK